MLDIPPPAGEPPVRLHRMLVEAMIDSGTSPPREAVEFALAVALGRVALLAATVDERPAEGGGRRVVKALTGVCRTELPGAVVWLNDATAVPAELSAVLGGAMCDVTPPGTLALVAPVLQIVPEADVTRYRSPGPVADQLRGILHDLPHPRVGLLTHRPHAGALPGLLGDPYRSRLTMVEYFGGGLSRGSNLWVEECDAVVVLGTPRVGSDAVRRHLLQVGDVRAAVRDGDDAGWVDDYWSGVTESGRRRTVRTSHHRDRSWHAAYCSMVWGELVQAIGRGRGILPTGIPVYVVTRENLAPPWHEDGREGYPIADRPFAPLTEPQARVLRHLEGGRNREGRPARPRCHAEPIARSLALSQQRVRQLLGELVAAGRVTKRGERGGWYVLA